MFRNSEVECKSGKSLAGDKKRTKKMAIGLQRTPGVPLGAKRESSKSGSIKNRLSSGRWLLFQRLSSREQQKKLMIVVLS
jgi:hypothetical protein